jgi:4-amino-4-deoxy-L-arabinose transferase-like glycosyltransferase
MQLPHPISFIIAIVALAAIYIAGLQVDVMDIDASQYASIALEMLQNGKYLQVQHLGQDYLDKPPLLFWTSALAFKLFGVHNWSYKLFSLLFSVLGAYSTYRFAKLYYSNQVAVWSALMLASCQALFLINNDVRTDTMLVGAVIFAIWQIADYLQTGRAINIIGAAVGIALAMLAKGPIGLMVPVLAFGSDWAFKGQWRNFFRWQWLVVILLVIIFLWPMLHGLYLQHGSFGPYFYFWAQSFGRLTGDNPFINSGLGNQPPSPLFFVHTILWSFLPWSALAIGGLWSSASRFFRNTFRVAATDEVITLWGFILPFIALSFSDYKLPHYIYVVLPFTAILASNFAVNLQAHISAWRIVHAVLLALLLVFATLLGLWAFPITSIILWVGFAILSLLAIYHMVGSKQWLVACLFAMLGANLLLNAGVYPKIMQYQSTSVAGKDITALKPANFFSVYARGNALEFYAMHQGQNLKYAPKQFAGGTIIYTNPEGLQELQNNGIGFSLLKTYPHYKVTALTWAFINPATRASKLQERYLLEVQ